jgi:hypothetical protein
MHKLFYLSIIAWETATMVLWLLGSDEVEASVARNRGGV